MKTRQEMVYDFMLALASSGNSASWDPTKKTWGEHIKHNAEHLVDTYLESLG
jgi:hypothetical protein